MADVTSEKDQDGVELSAADEQLIRELTDRCTASELTTRALSCGWCLWGS